MIQVSFERPLRTLFSSKACVDPVDRSGDLLKVYKAMLRLVGRQIERGRARGGRVIQSWPREVTPERDREKTSGMRVACVWDLVFLQLFYFSRTIWEHWTLLNPYCYSFTSMYLIDNEWFCYLPLCCNNTPLSLKLFQISNNLTFKTF